jgi:hypothetical protein
MDDCKNIGNREGEGTHNIRLTLVKTLLEIPFHRSFHFDCQIYY